VWSRRHCSKRRRLAPSGGGVKEGRRPV
jgi:hypothetical protein